MKRSELTPREKAVHTHGIATGIQIGIVIGIIIAGIVAYTTV